MTVTVTLTQSAIDSLDLSPVATLVEEWLSTGAIAQHQQDLQFEIDYPRDPADPRELSEIPEIRLWFLRLDARYPWLPYLLDWRIEFPRYTAMLVPHQFSPVEGIQYNPEALEIFVTRKLFVLVDWVKAQGISGLSKLKLMPQTVGIEFDDSFFELVA